MKELKTEIEFFVHIYTMLIGNTMNFCPSQRLFQIGQSCMDYAENYTCVYQDEAQSAHWSHEQVTLFFIVAYFRCHTCNEVAHDSLVFVTDDKNMIVMLCSILYY